MSHDDINSRIASGDKYKTKQGFQAIKDGVPASKQLPQKILKKPSWLNIRLETSEKYSQVKKLVSKSNLSTVCEEAKCPNITECWSHGTATIMLMGSVCTRACRFCAVDTGNPKGWLDLDEPQKSAEAVKVMGLKYVVLTSVDRDDLPDGGATHYANSIQAIRHICPDTKIEALTPDFQGKKEWIDRLLISPPDVFAQNLETVRRLTYPVRDKKAGYEKTLEVLKYVKETSSGILTKSSLMLGLGETMEEILEAMEDLLAAKVDILTLGQYLQPTKHHYPMDRFVPPKEFELLRKIGLEKGFYEVASGPMVRSSYRADKIFDRNNLSMEEK